MAKTALITGISGQDGAYLAKALLQRGYRVVGAQRRNAGINSGRLEELGILADVELADMELLEESNIRAVLRKLQPDEIYHLAAQSFVGLSFEQPLYTCDVNALGVLRLLECIREACPGARFYQASTSEMFGKAAGDAAKRDHALSSAQPVWREQAVRSLDHGELPRSLRLVRLLRHSLQSRIAAAWTRVRYPQGDARTGAGGPRQAGRPLSRQSRSVAGLGLCRGICRGHVDDAATGAARRLRARHRAHAIRSGISSTLPAKLSGSISSGAAKAQMPAASISEPARRLLS